MRIDNSNRPLSSDDSGCEDSIAHLSVVLAHRLRGLVAGIEGFTDLLNDTLLETEQRELAMKIMEGTARIESVLADLQLYGEPLAPVMLPVRVDEVLQELLAPLDDKERDRIQVEMNPDTSSRMLLADPFLLRQALLILLQNALEADRGASSVRLTIVACDASVRFEVWNDGAVDVEEAVDTIFTPFFTTKANNLGVGLSIARRIARLHDSAIELECSDSKRGTCFTFAIQEPDDDLT